MDSPKYKPSLGAQKLAAWLTLRGVSRADFSAASGLSLSYIAEILLGRKNAGRNAIEKINAATGGDVPPSVWFGGGNG